MQRNQHRLKFYFLCNIIFSNAGYGYAGGVGYAGVGYAGVGYAAPHAGYGGYAVPHAG